MPMTRKTPAPGGAWTGCFGARCKGAISRHRRSQIFRVSGPGRKHPGTRSGAQLADECEHVIRRRWVVKDSRIGHDSNRSNQRHLGQCNRLVASRQRFEPDRIGVMLVVRAAPMGIDQHIDIRHQHANRLRLDQADASSSLNGGCADAYAPYRSSNSSGRAEY